MERKIGRALVVGAGISGVRAALDLAETGYGVTLVDRAPHVGGILSQLDHQFPTNHCGMCKMLPLIERDAGSQYCLRKGLFHDNIDLRLATEVTAIEGDTGHFTVTLSGRPRFVDPQLCVGCGDCAAACPVEVPDRFNAGLSRRKAIYLPVPHAVPNPYVIDAAACTRCGACVPVCPTGAIELFQEKRRAFHVLVVDDELVVRDSLKEWLSEEGFSVAMAASGEEALEQLARQAFDVMLLDIKMPGMDGVEVLKKSKDLFPDLTVVMMTAYATVETAVEAMKIGALDYLIKPFDPEALVSKIVELYERRQVGHGEQIEVGAVVLCGGTDCFDPSDGKNTFGYGVFPNVLTSLEFERLLSGTGPMQGAPTRPSDGGQIRSIAWIQCVGSRDLQDQSDFCSGICCMAAVKEAMLAKERISADLEATIFYMDMRTFNKSFQRYRDAAEHEWGIRFERGRVHTVIQDDSGSRLLLRYADRQGHAQDAPFDLVVLSVGQRPAAGVSQLSDTAGFALNSWGFARTEPFSTARTQREGIFMGGSFTGLKDIAESVITAGAASLSASLALRAAGGGLALTASAEPVLYEDVSRQSPRILTVLCECAGALSAPIEADDIPRRINADPAVAEVVTLPRVCTAEGWQALEKTVAEAVAHGCNRVLIGACLPYVYARHLKALGMRVSLDPALMEVVDIRTHAFTAMDQAAKTIGRTIQSDLRMGIARLKQAAALAAPTLPVTPKALVVGGGVAGMTAALAIADHGYEVTLVEQGAQLGGNLAWLHETIENFDTRALLDSLRQRIEKHPSVQTHFNTRVVSAFGQAGAFYTTIEAEGGGPETIEHGVAILATGGQEAAATTYGYGESPAVITQKELAQKIAGNEIDTAALRTVVMIQCVHSREEPRNYCSRVCCASTLKHILALKKRHPDLPIYVFYRDMMAYGFAESYFTEARRAGAIFVSYDPDSKPVVDLPEGGDPPLRITGREPILGMDIEISADLLVLATGIVPTLPRPLAEAFGAAVDGDGFFQEAESKWRPVDALKEGVFACGICLGPRSITESIATAEAAAQRALRILSQRSMTAGKVTARVRDALCARCERCIDACPYGARWMDTELNKVRVNAVMCQGCGTCAATCPNSAAILEGFADGRMLDTIDAALDGVLDNSGMDKQRNAL
jgi:heterodisulfide reductase subunit A2